MSVEEEDCKLDTLCDLYTSLDITQATVFVNTRQKVGTLNAISKVRRPASTGQLCCAILSALLMG